MKGDIEEKIIKKLRKPCRKCNKMFQPTGRSETLCLNCFNKVRFKRTKKIIQKNKERNKLLTLIFSIFLISFVSSMYAGTNYTFELETTDNLFWDVKGNSSNMEGFSVYQEITDKSIITFFVMENMKPDNFTIILYSNTSSQVEVIKEVNIYSGGGGGHTRTITKEIIKEVPNYVTEYVDNKTTEYINNTKEIEVEVNETSFTWIILVGIILTITFFICYGIIKLITKGDRR